MGFFRAEGIKEYKAIASKNNGNVAIILETRNGKKSPAVELAVMACSPRQFTIKMNELKFFEKAFREKFPETGEYTYCRFGPIDEEFHLGMDEIEVRNSGKTIRIKKVPYYTGLLDR
ncbi:MAG TPA: hypothetical protein PK358_10275 [Spirochaetota bacterium]|nr:hypothetical protein [Spirochaetota bacterium]